MKRAGHVLLFQNPPLFASLLEQRRVCAAILGTLGVHMTLLALDLPSFQCPIRQALGVPCPGCGLSRAARLFLQGAWQNAIEVHAFAPLFLAGLAVMGFSLLLPGSVRTRVLASIGRIERAVPFSAIVLSALVMFWLVRLIWMRDTYYHLVW